MRESIEEFEKRDAQVLAVAPDDLESARTYFQAHDIPFPCLADPDRIVFRQYGVKSTMTSLGQRPGLLILDRDGVVRYAYLGWQQWEIPTISQTMAELDKLELRSA